MLDELDIDVTVEYPASDIVSVGQEVQIYAFNGASPYQTRWNDGEQYPNGLGPIDVFLPDYWALRARSRALFETNLYARGVVRRLVTNVIHTGLSVEASPLEPVLGLARYALAEWTESVEELFAIWAGTPRLCDVSEECTFGQLQATAYREALVAGDVLVALDQDDNTGYPRVRLTPGEHVQTPLATRIALGVRIDHGVERDANGKHLAYWVVQDDLSYRRIPAYGRNGRRNAWLVYASDKRHGEVRGQPLLGLIFHALKDVASYRISTQRKAALLASLAMYISRSSDKPGTRGIFGSGISRATSTIATTDSAPPREFRTAAMLPGLVLDELQQGEEPKAFQVNGTTESFRDFEAAVVNGIAWALEIPPEILTLSFQSSYSASKASNNEFSAILDLKRADFGASFCQPVYRDWLHSAVLTRSVDAPGYLDAVRDPRQFAVAEAWVQADWVGQVKPSIDPEKMARAYTAMVQDLGVITRDRVARELTGMKFSRVVRQLRLENAQLAEATRELQPNPALAPDQDPAQEESPA